MQCVVFIPFRLFVAVRMSRGQARKTLGNQLQLSTDSFIRILAVQTMTPLENELPV